MTKMLNQDDLRKYLPKHLHSSISSTLVQKLNGAIQDGDVAGYIRDNFISFTTVLEDGRFTIEEYMNAVKFVSLVHMGHTKKDAYIRTFPERHERHLANGVSDKDFSSYITAYSKTKLVLAVMDQSNIPLYILNQDKGQKALDVLVDVMGTSRNDLARVQAAKTILEQVQKLAPAQIDVNLNVNKGVDMVTQLKQSLDQMVTQQLELMDQGVTPRAISEMRLVNPED